MGACNSSDDSGTGGVTATNDADLSSLQAKVIKKLRKHRNQSSKRVFSKQNISLKENRTGPLDPYYQKEVSASRGPFGIFGSGKDCPLFHCSYDINQSSNFNIYSYNSILVAEAENIYQDIETEVLQTAETSLDGNPSGVVAANAAANESREIAKSNITDILTNISKMDIGNEQHIDIEYQSPPRCKDPCGLYGDTRGPTLNQDAQLIIHSNDIINSTLKIFEENFQRHGLDVDQSISTSNDNCTLLMVGGIICSLICLIIVWKAIKMAEN